MDFASSAVAQEYLDRLSAFLDEQVFPAEHEYEQWVREQLAGDHTTPPVLQRLKQEARARGLWNFLPGEGHPLSVLDYAPLAEMTGWSMELAPEAINCSAPDTGNMEVLHMFGTSSQKERWLQPLLAGEIRSAFAMTEPEVASSPPTSSAASVATATSTSSTGGSGGPQAPPGRTPRS